MFICPELHNALDSFQVKLCDFGNSQRLKSPSKSIILKKLAGTVSYMAPEMLKKNHVSTASDIYAMGITMWQLLYGKIPYADLNNEEQVIYGVVKNNLRPSDETLDPSDSLTSSCHWRFFGKSVRSLPRPSKRSKEVDHELPVTEGLTYSYSSQSLTESLQINWNHILITDLKYLSHTSVKMFSKYQELYIKCWHRKSHHRPCIAEVLNQVYVLLDESTTIN